MMEQILRQVAVEFVEEKVSDEVTEKRAVFEHVNDEFGGGNHEPDEKVVVVLDVLSQDDELQQFGAVLEKANEVLQLEVLLEDVD